MPINLVMQNISIKTATPDERGNLPEFPVTISDIEIQGATHHVNSVFIGEDDAMRLLRILEGWRTIVLSARHETKAF